MALTGFKYYWDKLALDTDSYLVHYDFNAPTGIPSTQSQKPMFSGVLSGQSASSFFQTNGSGNFSGGVVAIQNSELLNSEFWTHFFIYERTNPTGGILFNSFHDQNVDPYIGGYILGVTDNNRLYFEAKGQAGPMVKVGTRINGKKNAVACVKARDILTFHVYNFDTKELESESFTLAKYNELSNNYSIGGAITPPSYLQNRPFYGYMDEYVYVSEALTPANLRVLFSGFYSEHTDVPGVVTTSGYLGITGYSYVFSGITGVTGYDISEVLSGYDQFGDEVYTRVETPMTGYIMSGYAQVPMTGVITVSTTGDPTHSFVVDENYGLNFGYNEITYMRKMDWNNVSYLLAATGYNRTNINNIAEYDRVDSTFEMKDTYNEDQAQIFLNGIYQVPEGYSITGDFYGSGLVLTGSYHIEGFKIHSTGYYLGTDTVIYDVLSGTRETYIETQITSGNVSLVTIDNPNDKMVFLNGVLQVQGIDYGVSGGHLRWQKNALGGQVAAFYSDASLVGYTGVLFGTLPEFQKETTKLFRNGQRQLINRDYIENSSLDLLRASGLFETNLKPIYNNDPRFLQT